MSSGASRAPAQVGLLQALFLHVHLCSPPPSTPSQNITGSGFCAAELCGLRKKTLSPSVGDAFSSLLGSTREANVPWGPLLAWKSKSKAPPPLARSLCKPLKSLGGFFNHLCLGTCKFWEKDSLLQGGEKQSVTKHVKFKTVCASCSQKSLSRLWPRGSAPGDMRVGAAQ